MLCPSDDAIRNELCPVGYVLADHSRTGRRGCGTALVYRNSLTVRKIDAGEKAHLSFPSFFELSEFYYYYYCHFLFFFFVMFISGAKFELHNSNTSRYILDLVLQL